MDSQLSLPDGTNKNYKRIKKTKNKLMSVINPVQSHDYEGCTVGLRVLFRPSDPSPKELLKEGVASSKFREYV